MSAKSSQKDTAAISMTFSLLATFFIVPSFYPALTDMQVMLLWHFDVFLFLEMIRTLPLLGMKKTFITYAFATKLLSTNLNTEINETLIPTDIVTKKLNTINYCSTPH